MFRQSAASAGSRSWLLITHQSRHFQTRAPRLHGRNVQIFSGTTKMLGASLLRDVSQRSFLSIPSFRNVLNIISHNSSLKDETYQNTIIFHQNYFQDYKRHTCTVFLRCGGELDARSCLQMAGFPSYCGRGQLDNTKELFYKHQFPQLSEIMF